MLYYLGLSENTFQCDEIVAIAVSSIVSLKALHYYIFTHMELCLATAIHNFKWLKII